MNKKILILTHGAKVLANNIELMFSDIGYETHIISMLHGDTFPQDITKYSAMIIMGGIVGVNDKETLSWLNEEIIAIEGALKYNIPTLGICLGAQILSHIYGGKITKGEDGMSVGFQPISIIEKDAIFGDELHNTPVCKWHGDCFSIPKSAIHLATSEPYKNQAVKFENGVYGVQFHPEITPCRVLEWYGDYDHFPETAPSLEKFIQQCKTHIPTSHNWLKLFFCRLLNEN